MEKRLDSVELGRNSWSNCGTFKELVRSKTRRIEYQVTSNTRIPYKHTEHEYRLSKQYTSTSGLLCLTILIAEQMRFEGYLIFVKESS